MFTNKELIILPDGSKIYQVVSDYSFDEDTHRWRAQIEHEGVKYDVQFYNNFWA